MAKEETRSGFRCPEVVPPNAPDDFCIPEECCPDRLETFKFPSPNSCLPEEVLEELELKITAANEFLLDIALSGELNRNEIFRNVFRGLVGQIVEVELDCPADIQGGSNNLVLKGRVFLTGRDFSILRNEGQEIAVPHEKICFIRPKNSFAEPVNEETLNDIDPCLRRCLTYRFGAVVSGSPELIQIFFGLDLRTFLLTLIDKTVKVRLIDDIVEGSVFDVDEETLILCVGDEKRTIALTNICFIVNG